MIHVLTLTWDGLDKLEKLRPGLINNLKETVIPYQWYIRDNGSKDKTVEVTKTWEDTTVFEAFHNRSNFAQGVNSLIAIAKAHKNFNIDKDVFMLLNNDVEFRDNFSFTHMLSLMREDVGAVGSRLLYTGTQNLQHAGVIFGEKYGRMPYHFRHQELSDTNAEKNRYFQAVTAAVCLVRAKDLIAIGGLDEKFHWAFEDIDMCLRLKALGKKNIYCGKTKIFHEESASLKKNPVNKLFLGPNVEYFKTKWFGKYELDHDKYLKDPSYNEL